jgi:hypothetical protein
MSKIKVTSPNLGIALGIIRRSLGYNIVQVSKGSKLSSAHVSKMETDAIVSLDSLRRVATFYLIPLSAILALEEFLKTNGYGSAQQRKEALLFFAKSVKEPTP